MIIRPAFYEPLTLDCASEQRRLGLDPSKPTGLVLFGGHGSKAMLNIARRLADTTQLILVCGHNQALARQLQALPGSAPRVVVGFTADIPRWMQLADFFIGKPGPGSISEAVQQGLPVIVVDNALTMPQERYNAQWVRENELGLVLRSFRRIDHAVARLVANLDHWRTSVRRVRNRALFEVPPILAQILDGAQRLQPELEASAGRALSERR
jgi:UDP-N-acetylglucosamine:LPS N-acetylglucosamine transferase